MSTSDFRSQFSALTGVERPFPWQEALFSELVTGSIRGECDVPTGLGKTSAIAVWLCALGSVLSDRKSGVSLPRRLIYIVDRRVVVDQATEEVDKLRKALLNSQREGLTEPIFQLRSTLQRASVIPDPAGVTISTLRGKFADNHDWHFDPSRPSIAVGTVDMIGSRILFSGYGGLGRNWRSLQAGLLLQDAWIVLDEAHLAPAFHDLLLGVRKQRREISYFPPFGITCMSATLPTKIGSIDATQEKKETPLFTKADEDDDRVEERFRAKKTLRFVVDQEVTSAKKGAAQAEALARAMSAAAVELGKTHRSVVVFANTVDAVERIETALKAALPKEERKRVLALTGEMRGYEKERVAASDVIAAFAPQRARESVEPSAFLIATSCIEVGMDFDADAAVCDSVALERMIQRFGRVNRRGKTASEILVITTFDSLQLYPTTIDQLAMPEATCWALSQLPTKHDGHDASPAALRALAIDSTLTRCAFSRALVAPPLDSARLDDWSLTSLKPDQFPKPQVSYWLRGVITDDSVTVSFVWRAELHLARNEEEAAAMIETIPVAPREVAQVSIDRATKFLEALGKKHPSLYCLVRSLSGDTRWQKLSEYADKERKPASIAFSTVFLPVQAGGLRDGLVDRSDEALGSPVVDVVNRPADLVGTPKEGEDSERWERVLLTRRGGEIVSERISENGSREDLGGHSITEAVLTALAKTFRRGNANVIVRCETTVGTVEPADGDIAEEDGDENTSVEAPEAKRAASRLFPQAIAYFHITTDPSVSRDEDARSLGGRRILLKEHSATAEAVARALIARFTLPPDIAEAVVLAARWHDRGKDRRCWQEGIGNRSGDPLAKSDRPYFDVHRLAGYRHEFGSLVEALEAGEIQQHDQRELILHLIAAHHGHARPSFERRAFDPETPALACEAIAAEVPLRFARLQTTYGWWSLAWLEALVKAADAIASKHPDWSPA